MILVTNLIEQTDRQQQRYWRGYLITFFLAVVLLIVRYLFGTVFAEHELNSRPIGILVLVASVALLATMLVLVVRLGMLKARAAADPELKEALIDNELVRLHLAQSWKAAFIGAVTTPFVFLLISTFHPFDDLLVVALSTASVGAGVFLVTFYLKSNA
jgi:hypothetical protein